MHLAYGFGSLEVGSTCPELEELVEDNETLERVESVYDERNRPVVWLVDNSIPTAAGQMPGYQFDHGLLRDTLAPGQNVIASAARYDRLGRLTVAVDSDTDVSEAQYDGIGRPLVRRDAVGNETRIDYDALGNATRVESIEKSTYAVDPFTEDFVYTSVYDALNRLRSESAPNGETTTFAYDARDNLVQRVDQLGNKVNWTYDAATRLRSSTQAVPSNPNHPLIVIGQTWDDLGRLKTRVDGTGLQNVTEYTYDALDRQTRIDYGDGTFTIHAYNADDEMIGYVGQAGEIHRLCYDAEGRVIYAQHTPPSAGATDPQFDLGDPTTAHVQVWSYDGLGRPWVQLDSNGPGGYNDVQIECAYDTLGRVVLEQQTLDFTSATTPGPYAAFTYQGANRLKQQDYPSGRTVTRTYDGLDRLAQVNCNLTGHVATRYYIGPSRLLRQEYGNDTVLDNRGSGTGSSVHATAGGNPNAINKGYDENGRPIHVEWRTLSDQELTSYSSAYNGPDGVGIGRRQTERRNHLFGRTDTYMFDEAYRMIGFMFQTDDGTGATVTYTSTRELDEADSMVSFNDMGVQRMPVVDGDPAHQGLNQYSSVDGEPRRYDQLGALQSLSDTGTQSFNGHTLRFDTLSRLTRLLDASTGAEAIEYVYDTVGRRIAKFSTSGATPVQHERYFYDGGWRVLDEQCAAGDWAKSFIDGDGIDEHLQYRKRTGSSWLTFYYHSNSQGFIGAISDAGGAVREYLEYEWLGAARLLDDQKVVVDNDVVAPGVQPARGSAIGSPYGMHGRRWDRDAGLYLYRNRFYEATSGTFVSVDPSGLWKHGQGNGYSAFAGDSWNRLDPLGLDVRVTSTSAGAQGEMHHRVSVDVRDAAGKVVGQKHFSFGADGGPAMQFANSVAGTAASVLDPSPPGDPTPDFLPPTDVTLASGERKSLDLAKALHGISLTVPVSARLFPPTGGNGSVYEDVDGPSTKVYRSAKTTAVQDREILEWLSGMVGTRGRYSFLNGTCRSWSWLRFEDIAREWELDVEYGPDSSRRLGPLDALKAAAHAARGLTGKVVK
ncbi:MAG: RHS repeat-associated core domain-containing protein [Bacteroidota bacterium]